MTLMVDNVRIDFCRGAKHAKLGGVSNLDLQQVIAHDVVQFPRVLGRTAYVKIRYGNLPVLYCLPYVERATHCNWIIRLLECVKVGGCYYDY